LLAGLVLLTGAAWVRLFKLTSGHEASTQGRRSVAAPESEPEVVPILGPMVSKALACSGTRQDVLDTIAGAPYEFVMQTPEDQAFYRLPRLAASAAMLAPEIADTPSEEELRHVVQQMAAGLGWPVSFKQRLLMVLQGSCEAKSVCTEAQQALPLEVDEEFTSRRAKTSGWLHQAILDIGALTGLAKLKARAELYRSRPAEVVLSSTRADAQTRECLALRGNRTSLALHVSGSNQVAIVQQIVIEQPQRWAALRPRSLPRRFSVFGWPGNEIAGSTGNKYSVALGRFEYSAAAPAVQAFQLTSKVQVKGLRLVFEGPGWGESYICLYRVKAFEKTGPACSGGRVAFSETTGK